jgi:hydrogenase nickel incorporation protein HypA/HybF
MHELSLAHNLVDAVMGEWERIDPPPRRLIAARVALGQLRQVVPEYLVSAYEVLVRGTPLDGSRLDVRICPWRARCRACGWSGERTRIEALCPACGGFELETLSGEELCLEKLEIEVPDEA